MKDITVSTYNISNEEFPIKSPKKSGTIAIDKDSDDLYYSNALEWKRLISEDDFENVGLGSEVLVSDSTNPIQFRRISGSGIVTIVQSDDTLTISESDSSYSEDKSGTQLIDATEDFTYTTVAPWAQLGVGRYNTGEFNETTGVYTAPSAGKYLFTSIIRTSAMIATSTIFYRLLNVTQGIQLCEVSLPGNLVTPNGGLILQFSHECSLEEGEEVDARLCYLVPPGSLPVDPMQVVPFLGSSVFTGRRVK